MKISKSLLLGMSAIVVLLLISDQANAQWGRGVKGNGKVVTQERDPGNFSGIKVNCSADVYIKQGSQNQVIVKADENLLEMIETEVTGDILKVDINGSISNVKQLDVFITVENLNTIQINGSGDVESENTIQGIDLEIGINGSGNVELDLDMKNVRTSINGSGDVSLSGVNGDFELKISGSGGFDGKDMRLNVCEITVFGSGDVELSGSATKVDLEQSASGDINLYNLDAQDATVTSNGSGDIVVSVSGNLKAKLRGSGDLTYKGTPISVDVSATGSGDVYHR
ncbi:MAG: DUF2807 domain-containing protein [Bacteroidales bacterium]|nr:DUF2807 domain-containing protein [Bacteroidales bacterium]